MDFISLTDIALKALTERFWAKVNKTDGCWLWTGCIWPGGYGRFSVGRRKRYRAHRIAWVLTHGSIPDELDALHKCDTPLCVRPDHLFLGTHDDNMKDCASKGRTRCAKKTHCPQGHPLSGDNLYTYRGERCCRQCKNAHCLRYYYIRMTKAKIQSEQSIPY